MDDLKQDTTDTKHVPAEALRAAGLAEAPRSVITDRVRLDWLERIMTPRDGYVEVYLAGLRNGDAPATAYQFETNPHDPKWCLTTGKTLREAIDEALTRYWTFDRTCDYAGNGMHSQGMPM
jgi:hypothetical protein